MKHFDVIEKCTIPIPFINHNIYTYMFMFV